LRYKLTKYNAFMNPDLEQIPSSELPLRLPPIPLESVEGWKEKPIKGLSQELVPLGPFTDFSDCDTSAVYFGERGGGPEMNYSGQVLNFAGKKVSRKESSLTHFVRQDVYDRLIIAQKALSQLAPGYYFKFYDGYRPLSVQQELYDIQRENVKKQNPEWQEDQGSDKQKLEAKRLIDEATHKAIAIPAADDDIESRAARPAPHTTGSAIDLRLIKLSQEGLKQLASLEEKKRSGVLKIEPEESKVFEEVQVWIQQQDLLVDKKENWLEEYRYGMQKALIFRNFSEIVDMGTGFDDFSAVAEMAFYENISEDKITEDDRKRRDNRRLLYKVMNDVGFLSYPGEWWHFSYGDQEWAANKKQPEALFGEVGLSEANRATEQARRLAYLKTIRSTRKGQDPILL